ncbi:O-antigen ligase like membrane protein [Erythrobacter litoralis]|uniref:Uncharacterized protein n=1 Tax=Erythrobacter litoralis TaxID=39960 RepID=A0A074N082_9SPHN|nr:hypothetical protein [Erythrobacter litoralis]AOL22395.1 O-antigen ligase like membrane protein [Erythrobacter litoralis]KEO99059.1 hypothetical protein EH32_08125 [Erythrobacter litoralis]
MPNTIAYAMLIIWPAVTLALFAKLRPAHALIWSLLGGYLVLPVNTRFDISGIPALDKTSIPSIAALIGALLFVGPVVLRLPRKWWLMGLMALYVLSPMLTVLTNPDPLVFGSVMLPGLKPYDAFSAAAYNGVDLIPFLLGYNMLQTDRSHDYLLRALVAAMLCYSLLMLIEIRLSPQLHTWIYGFFPHSFGQQMRDGGFRPVVFLGHGLLVAILTSMTIIAAAYIARQRGQILGVSAWFWLAYLMGIMVLCKSLGALILTIAALPVALFMRREAIRLICALIAITVLVYPMMRGADVVPVQALADQVAAANSERASSFQTRIDNENSLLERAGQRFLFGWGGYGRNRIYDEDTGKDLSITDGTWVIVIGNSGWIGYISTFGLLCLPMLRTWWRGSPLSAASAALSLIMVVNLLDLLPNSSLTPLTWLLAGTLAAIPQKTDQARQSKRFKSFG